MTKKEKIEIEEEIRTTLSKLLEKLQIEAGLEVSPGEGEDTFKVNIDTKETGLLIGYHGETLNGLQLLLGVILYRKLGKWLRIILDVGDYRKARQETIKEMVTRIVSEVESTNQPVVLPYLTPFERRIVHLMLADNKKVVSVSSGEGRDRRITISPKNPS